MHLINLFSHIGAGIAAIGLGFLLLASAKATPWHRERGRVFVALTLLVCATSVVGNVFFRFIPLLAVLTVVVAYQLLSGWHVIYTKAAGPNRIDALLSVCAAGCAMFLIPLLLSGNGTRVAAPTVIYSSLGALVFLLAYDTVRWCFPRRWHATLWRYEHIFKVVASVCDVFGSNRQPGEIWTALVATGPYSARHDDHCLVRSARLACWRS
jgi:uncharacterized membrane protein